ncbi:MAG: hypothetical protein C0478_16200 [Planctomyces sp.]|nr:hypothetical protein [Planctomyces sp.]
MKNGCEFQMELAAVCLPGERLSELTLQVEFLSPPLPCGKTLAEGGRPHLAASRFMHIVAMD